MEDIAPELLEKIQGDFRKSFEKNKKIQSVYGKIREGTADYKAAHEFALEIGELLTEAMGHTISSRVLPDGRMYYNIAEKILEPTLSNNHNLASEVAAQVQQILNEKANIGLKAIKPEINTDRVQGIIETAANAEQYDDIAGELHAAVINFTQAVIDEAVRENADFQYKAGLEPQIIRTATGKCCEWCAKLTGTYDYEKVSDRGNDVFRRHKRCKCLVEYAPGDGRRQNVHTRRWSDEEKNDKIEKRKQINPRNKEPPKQKEKRIDAENNLGLLEKIASHPKMLQAYTPKGLKAALENKGYEVKPLARGSLKGVPYEEGGGYKVNFGGDGILQYHPEEGSHHNGAYYKISTGEGGKKRYDLKGEEKED